MSHTRARHVLFLCTGNSARSILAEAIGNHLAPCGLVFHSAGSTPAGTVNDGARAELAARGLATGAYHSKSWDQFTGAEAPALDWVITLCDNAANEPCPVFSGDYANAHWGLPDPATEQATFTDTYATLVEKIAAFIGEISI